MDTVYSQVIENTTPGVMDYRTAASEYGSMQASLIYVYHIRII